jgi:GDPmannose 4,6-dehydratase
VGGPIALITGITGQDGSYLAELLLDKGYEVHGIVRRIAFEDPENRLWRIQNLQDRLTLHPGSLESFASIYRVIEQIRPVECYHLAAQSFVSYAFDDEFSTIETNIRGTHHILSALKEKAPGCRMYFAATSEMFGAPDESPQNERTHFQPRSPYGISKVAGYHLTRSYRDAYDLFACSGILYNHESERRGFEYVTRKISNGVARIKLGLDSSLTLGNLDALRDWGYAPEYVHAMWLMLQQDQPEDFVVASGVTHSVRDFAALAFEVADLRWQDYVQVDEQLHRPAEEHPLCGDASKAHRMLGWSPSTPFEGLVKKMVLADLKRLNR